MAISSAHSFFFHFCLLLLATVGLPFLISYLHFTAAASSSFASPSLWVVTQGDNPGAEWFQSSVKTTQDALTLIPVAAPPIDLLSLEHYYMKQPSVRDTQQQMTLRRSNTNDNICSEYKAREYCSSRSSSFSGSYIHASSGASMRITLVTTPPIPFSLPSYLKDSPATSFLLLLQTILALTYWNARLSPSAVGLLFGQVNEPWRWFTGAMAHFDVWHLGMNMMTLSSLGTALEYKRVGSMAFFATSLSMTLFTGILWWILQWLLRFSSSNHPSIPTVGYSGVLFAWLVVLSMEQGSFCPVFFLPDLCFSAVSLGGGFSIHPGPLIQLVMMQLLLPRASWTGHLAGIVVGFVYQWRLLSDALWWPAISIPFMHFLWCLQQDRTRFLSRRRGFCSSNFIFLGMTHCFAWMCSLLELGGGLSKFSLEYLILVLWWFSTRSDDTTMARGYAVVALFILVTDAMTAGAWMVMLRPVWGFMLPSILTLVCRTVVSMITLVWMIHSHLLYQETPSGIFYYALNWTVLKPTREILMAIDVAEKNSVQESLPSSWNHLGAGRRLGGTRDHDMVRLI
ncbi:rhomboid domain-containing protein 1 [Fistulifera solaris]|uniref:Rhomboid domain-containing protein 1 n=1 Tax=Fistulifera solaris TaxID=1519565 RepID=A0A1Z5KD00_FISSO|nr:rhomboid domain-containing protein 1 [Fistulifera solaris]|eukprot:GAX23971.1 rhomboid domain-containing protein 1 [Fistulifera solaris]